MARSLASEFDRPTLVSERVNLIEPLKPALALPLMLPANPHWARPIKEAAGMKAGPPFSQVKADIRSISLFRISLLAGFGRTLPPLMPLRLEVEAGLLHVSEIVDPPTERVLAVCSSRHILASSAAQAVRRLTRELVAQLRANKR